MRNFELMRKKRPARFVDFIFVAVLAAALFPAGCSKKAPVPAPPPRMLLDITSDIETNRGQPFYLVVRAINDKQFLTDNYQGIAGLVFADPPDPSVLTARAILPGKQQQITMDKPTQASVGLYFLFSDRIDQWKRMLSQPLSESGYQVTITKNVIAIDPKKSFWRKIWPF